MPKQSSAHSAGAIRAIAIFKWVKGLLLVAAGVGALKLVHADIFDLIARVGQRFNLEAHQRTADAVLSKVLNVAPGKLTALGIGAFAYGALFLVEGTGLWLQKRWAEYLTIVSTAGFIPIEIYELTRRFDVERVVVLVINVAIVVYLVWRLRSERREERRTPQRAPRLHQAPQPVR